MFDWARARPWDERYRIAFYAKDFITALDLAREHIRRAKSPAEAETMINMQSGYAEQSDPSTVDYFRAMYEAIRQRFPADEVLHLLAMSDLAYAMGPTEEGIAAAELVYSAWDRAGVPRDSEDAWPKTEPRANIARRRLASLYMKAGRATDAESIFPHRVCRHFKPLLDHFASSGITGECCRIETGSICYSVNVVLDVEGLRKNLSLDPALKSVDYFDPRSYIDLGFDCASHLDSVRGIHYQALDHLDPRRAKEHWFR